MGKVKQNQHASVWAVLALGIVLTLLPTSVWQKQKSMLPSTYFDILEQLNDVSWKLAGYRRFMPNDENWAVPDWMEVVGKVELASISSDFFSRKSPAILKDSPAKEWQALHSWTTEYLAEHFPNRSVVIRNNDESNVFVYEDDRQYMRHASAELEKAIPGPKLIKQNMTLESFFDLKEPAFISSLWDEEYTSRPALETQIFPRDFMFVLPDTASSSRTFAKTGDREYSSHIWIAREGAVTGLHYDGAFNMFAQVRGCKRFILVPPSEWQGMRIFPVGHINNRQSQLELDGVSPSTPLKVFIADLGPGDVLYLPPFWGHRVAAFECQGESISMSVNTWSRAPEERLTEELAALESLPSRFLDQDLGLVDKLSQLAIFFEHIIKGVSSLEPRDLFLNAVVKGRLMAQRGLAGALGCAGFSKQLCPASLFHFAEEYARSYPSVAAQVRKEAQVYVELLQSEPSAGQDVIDLLLVEFLERAVAYVATLPMMCPFLLCTAA